MKILNHTNNHPVNSLAAAVQSHCNTLMASPEEHQINDLQVLDRHLQEYTKKISPDFRLCKPGNLKGEVHSYLTFEVYSLLYKQEILLISIVSRKTEYESAFRNYDGLGNNKPVTIN